MRTRTLLVARGGAALAATGTLVGVLAAGPASAAAPAVAPQAAGLSMVEVLGIYGGIPLLLFLGISFLVVLPQLLRAGRERGESLGTGAVWVGGPGEGPDADTAAQVAAATERPAGNRGGASARW